MKLLVGLGNPGKKYEKTRHNFGFLALEAFAKDVGVDFQMLPKFKAEVAQLSSALGQDKIFLLKPQTYMNLSGQSVGPFARFYQILPQDILVIYDDLDLPLGRMRFATKGGAGGHNGMKSLIQVLGTQEFSRLKLGIGRPKHPGQDVVDYVLQKFAKDELVVVKNILHASVEALHYYLKSDVSQAANQFNGQGYY